MSISRRGDSGVGRDPNLTAVERAFLIARSGKVTKTRDLRLVLKAEGYSDDRISDPSMLKQLRDLMRLGAVKAS